MEDQRDYPSYHQSDYPKMIDQQEDFQEEDSLEVEDSQVEEYLEEVEDTPEEEAHWEQDRQDVTPRLALSCDVRSSLSSS